MQHTFDLSDQQLLATVTTLLNERSFGAAQRLLTERVAGGLILNRPAGLMFLAEIAGFLIDVGAEGYNEQAVKDGLALLEDHRHHFAGLLTTASLEYNLGNAKNALVDIHTQKTGKGPGLADHDLLLAAKNHYWRAVKALDSNDTFAHRVNVNLGSVLRASGRITEALMACDEVLANDPDFTMAHYNRAISLEALERISGETVPNLLAQIAHEYATVADATDEPPGLTEIAATNRDHTIHRLNQLGYTTDDLDRETHKIAEEATQHSPYRRFTLKHHLGLSEHALYCPCTGARRDDLMIANPATPVTGERIPRWELILNRLKAEFATARLLYYQATHDRSWPLYEHDVTFTELFEGEHISINTELLRTSFRLCLGILDKICLGVCELYDVAAAQEKLQFESFWQPPSKNGKAGSRWVTLGAHSTNPSLVALYSQAADLQLDGEWRHFKDWRNHLEHRFLLLTDDQLPPDRWHARAGTFETLCIPISAFTEQTLRLLQFTRSAIFNFTFCVRHETTSEDNDPSITRTLQHKTPEPTDHE